MCQATRDKTDVAIDYITDIVSNQVFKPWELKETVPRLKLDLAQLPPSTQALELLHQAAFRYHTLFIRVSDPDPDWIRIQSGQWIRIRIRNPDPDPGGQK